LTIAEVEEKWSYVRRRIGTRKDGAKIAALLQGYTVVGIDGTREMPIVVCKAKADFHYNTLQGNDTYHETIRWALKVTLEMECDIRLLAPHVSYSGPGVSQGFQLGKGQNGSGPSMSFSPSNGPRMSASLAQPIQLNPLPPVTPLERPMGIITPLTSRPEVASDIAAEPLSDLSFETDLLQEPDWLRSELSSMPPVENIANQVSSSSPLARNGGVSENTTGTTVNRSTRLGSMQKDVERNPVVSEVMRIFKAKINDVQPK